MTSNHLSSLDRRYCRWRLVSVIYNFNHRCSLGKTDLVAKKHPNRAQYQKIMKLDPYVKYPSRIISKAGMTSRPRSPSRLSRQQLRSHSAPVPAAMTRCRVQLCGMEIQLRRYGCTPLPQLLAHRLVVTSRGTNLHAVQAFASDLQKSCSFTSGGNGSSKEHQYKRSLPAHRCICASDDDVAATKN